MVKYWTYALSSLVLRRIEMSSFRGNRMKVAAKSQEKWRNVPSRAICLCSSVFAPPLNCYRVYCQFLYELVCFFLHRNLEQRAFETKTALSLTSSDCRKFHHKAELPKVNRSAQLYLFHFHLLAQLDEPQSAVLTIHENAFPQLYYFRTPLLHRISENNAISLE